jgi:hypothetical protein
MEDLFFVGRDKESERKEQVNTECVPPEGPEPLQPVDAARKPSSTVTTRARRSTSLWMAPQRPNQIDRTPTTRPSPAPTVGPVVRGGSRDQKRPLPHAPQVRPNQPEPREAARSRHVQTTLPIREIWCCERGLNSRPLPYQGSALPLSYRSPSAFQTAAPDGAGAAGSGKATSSSGRADPRPAEAGTFRRAAMPREVF